MKNSYPALKTALLCALAAAAGPLLAASFPDPTVPLSCGVQLKAGNANAENLDAIKTMGAKYVRRGFLWESVEKSPGVYDFSIYDKLLDECKQRGISMLGCIALNNKLYGSVKDDAGRQAYVKYAAALADRYKDYDVIWELWNEPNIATFWGKHGKANTQQYADEYSALVKAAVPAMKKANPKCIVMAGATSGLWKDSYAWVGYCFKNDILKSGIDAWSVHPYTTKNPEEYLPRYAELRGMMKDAGAPADFPIVNSERGYPIGKAEGFAGGDPKLSLDYQAWHFLRQYLIDLLAGTKVTIWYEWSGKEGFSLFQTGEPTPAYNAAKVFLAEFNGYRLEKRIPLASERDFALLFSNKAGGQKLVAWTAPGQQESPDKAVAHAVDIPVEAKGTLDTFQIYGDKGTVEAKLGKVNLTLTGAPQYVIVRKSP